MPPEVHVTTVDHFQGKEAPIVVVSLVRSNPSGQIGFLSSPQRVNVLLSRARDTLILLGNPRCLLGDTGTVRSHAPVATASAGHRARQSEAMELRSIQYTRPWSRVSGNKHILQVPDSVSGGTGASDVWATVLRDGGIPVLHGVPAKCVRHGVVQILKSAEDFEQKAPKGGCSRRCKSSLSCGHKCRQKCHSGPCTCVVALCAGKQVCSLASLHANMHAMLRNDNQEA
jgi:hypothetical protein